MKGELLIGIGTSQFYVREGKFINAPPEYFGEDRTKHYLAPSGSQWTIEANEARQVHDGKVTRYPIKLKDTYGLLPYEDSEGYLWLSAISEMYRLRVVNWPTRRQVFHRP